MTSPSSGEVLQAWQLTELPLLKLLGRGRSVRRESCSGALRIAVLGDSATQHYCQALGAVLKLRGWWPEIYEAEFDTIQQEVFRPDSGLFAHAPQFVILFNAVQALSARFFATPEKSAVAEQVIDGTMHIWERIAATCGATILQHNFVVPLGRPYGNQTQSNPSTLAATVTSINARLLAAAASRGVRMIDTDWHAALVGKRTWFDERLWCHARQALSPSFLPALAKSVSDVLVAERGVGVKVVVVDLDNTMWGGILGDDGPDHIEIGPTELGLAFTRFQQELVEIRDRGVLLAVCSKNNQQLVEDTLASHPDMVLRRDDFVAVVANFDDKVTNLRAIRDRLNVSFDSFVFLDDSPFEREMVRRALPEVQVPELPPDPAGVVNALAAWGLFEGRAATAEDLERRVYYQTDAARLDLRKRHEDVEQYLADLQMVAEQLPLNGYTLPRAAQLVQRSNQFNLTTIRYSEEELSALGGDPDASAFCLRLSDRLGDNGIIAVLVVRRDGRALIVDTWIMSCRVLGRHVEELTLRLLAARAAALGCDRIIGRYTPTAKNGLVADLYTRLGFEPAGNDGPTRLYALTVTDVIDVALPIRMKLPPAKETA